MKRITLYYNQTDGGWTETWYQSSNLILTDPLAANAYDDVLKKAIAFRASGTYIYGMRQTIIDSVPKRSLFTPCGGKYYIANSSTGSLLPDVRQTDALYYIYSEDRTRKRPIFLRGLPDTDVTRDAYGIPTPNAAFTSKVKAYMNAAMEFAFQILVVDKSQAPPYQTSNVVSVAPDAVNANYSSIHITPGRTLVPGNLVIFRGYETNNVPGFPRIAEIKSTTGAPVTVFTIPYRYRASTATYLPAKMTATLYNVVTTPMAAWTFWNFSEHKVGRPFGVLRGRKRAAVKAQ